MSHYFSGIGEYNLSFRCELEKCVSIRKSAIIMNELKMEGMGSDIFGNVTFYIISVFVFTRSGDFYQLLLLFNKTVDKLIGHCFVFSWHCSCLFQARNFINMKAKLIFMRDNAQFALKYFNWYKLSNW